MNCCCRTLSRIQWKRISIAFVWWYVDDRRSCTVPLLAVIGCYPIDVGWLNIIIFMIGLLLGQFSTDIARTPLGGGDVTDQTSQTNLCEIRFTNTHYQLAYSQVLLQHLNRTFGSADQRPEDLFPLPCLNFKTSITYLFSLLLFNCLKTLSCLPLGKPLLTYPSRYQISDFSIQIATLTKFNILWFFVFRQILPVFVKSVGVIGYRTTLIYRQLEFSM